METRNIGIVMNGVTGRMGTNQHLIRSVLAIIKQGGVKVNDNLVLMPQPILTGRNENKLKPLAIDVAVRAGQIRRGQRLLLEGVGGGFTWGAALVDY